jgi:hypothetical protein
MPMDGEILRSLTSRLWLQYHDREVDISYPELPAVRKDAVSKVLEGVTIETFGQVVREANIRPGQRFSIVLDGARPARPKLADIAAKMRATAEASGLTTEIFDTIIAQN